MLLLLNGGGTSDILGYGRSHKDAAGWSFAEVAQEIAIALTRFDITQGFTLG